MRFRTAIHRLFAIVLAGIVGGGVYWITTDLLLGGSVALSWGVSAVILLRIWRLYPDYASGDGWQDGRWTGLGVGVLGLTAFEGLRTLPLSTEYSLGIILFVLGIYSVGYMSATMAELERHSGRLEDSENSTSTARPGES